MANKIILGTVQFGLNYGINNSLGKPNQATIHSILDLAFAKGIRLLDTAEAYGDSQEVIGQYHQQSENKFEVITKFSSRRDNLSATITKRVAQNLETLNVKSLYSYMFHSFGDFKKYYQEFRKEIKELKEAGVIGKFGVSVYTNEEIDELLTEEVDLIQLPFNLLDNKSQRSDVIKKARDRGIEIHTRSVFLQGLFFKNIDELSVKLKPLKPYLTEIREIAMTNNIALGDLSLNYSIQQADIDGVLIGVDSREQLNENIKSLGNKILSQTLEKIDAIKVKEIELLNPSNWNQ